MDESSNDFWTLIRKTSTLVVDHFRPCVSGAMATACSASYSMERLFSLTFLSLGSWGYVLIGTF